jgi:hypothetical protein
LLASELFGEAQFTFAGSVAVDQAAPSDGHEPPSTEADLNPLLQELSSRGERFAGDVIGQLG